MCTEQIDITRMAAGHPQMVLVELGLMVKLLEKKINMRYRYFRYLHQTNTVVFSILFSIRWVKFYVSGPAIGQADLFAHAYLFFHWPALLAMKKISLPNNLVYLVVC